MITNDSFYFPDLDSKIFNYENFVYKSFEQLLKAKMPEFFTFTTEKQAATLVNRFRINSKSPNLQDELNTHDLIEFKHLREDEIVLCPKLDILYEDESILAIDKPDLLSVTPSSTCFFNSLVLQVREQFNLPEANPLHRLDMETTGVLLFSKSLKNIKLFAQLYAKNNIEKEYLAIVYGDASSLKKINGTLQKKIGSKIFSKFELLEDGSDNSETQVLNCQLIKAYSELVLKPITGKTNQIRIHLAAMGHPIVGDKKYYFDESIYLYWYNNKHLKVNLPAQSQLLHARELSFIHPILKTKITIKSKNRFYDQKKVLFLNELQKSDNSLT